MVNLVVAIMVFILAYFAYRKQWYYKICFSYNIESDIALNCFQLKIIIKNKKQAPFIIVPYENSLIYINQSIDKEEKLQFLTYDINNKKQITQIERQAPVYAPIKLPLENIKVKKICIYEINGKSYNFPLIQRFLLNKEIKQLLKS